MSAHRIIFHPLFVTAISLFAAFIFALFITLHFTGEFRWFLLYYFVPIAVPFVAFIFDRLERWHEINVFQWAIEIPVLVLAFARALIPIPLISGHALFLSFALLTTHSATARLTAFLVVIEVFYLKIFVWADLTLIGGALLGCLAAMLYRRNESTGFSLPVSRIQR